MNANTTAQPENDHQSTYALLIRSTEKRRNIFEAAIQLLLISAPLVAIWQFAHQPISIPPTGLKETACAACTDEGKTFAEARRPEIEG